MKTATQHVESAVKYSGGSVTAALAVSKIVVFAFPHLAPIETEIQALVTIAANIVAVYFFKIKG